MRFSSLPLLTQRKGEILMNIYLSRFNICRYKHYLRPEDEQLAKNIWDLIQQNNDPTNAQYHFTVRCSAGGAECPAGRYVLIFPLLFPFYSHTVLSFISIQSSNKPLFTPFPFFSLLLSIPCSYSFCSISFLLLLLLLRPH